ncbi:MAG: hypothetical protein VX278_14720 [Myxococcota bacterium]|nr:hypothetical protein [Myxococcota bacterium]
MKNFLISIVAAVLGFLLGWWGGNYNWLAGIPVSLFLFILFYFILARRSFNKLSELSQGIMGIMQQAQVQQDPEHQIQAIDQAVTLFTNGLSLGKEQFLIRSTLHSQIGTMHYQAAGLFLQLRLRESVQGSKIKANKYKSKAKERYAQAKLHFQEFYRYPWQVWFTRNWQAVAMMAAIDYREGKKDSALKQLDDVKGPGGSDLLYYGIYGWLLHQCGQSDKALIILSEGVEKNGSSEALKGMLASIQNKKEIDVTLFGMNWFSFFPEQLDQKMIMRMQSQMMENQPNGAQNLNRAQRRALKKQKR